MNELEVLSLLDQSKEHHRQLAENIVADMEKGLSEPLHVHRQLKCMQNLIDNLFDKKTNPRIAKRYNELILDAAQRIGTRFALFNADFAVKETAIRYDWTVCNDEELIALIDQHEKIGKLIREKQEFLKKVPLKGIEILVAETGQLVTVYPPAKSSTTVVSVTLK